MSHRATVYTVEVHRNGDPGNPCALGDIDGYGTNLLDWFGSYLKVLDTKSPDGSNSLGYLQSRREGNELFAMLEYGEVGVEAVIRDRSGQHVYHQQVEDWQNVECGCVFSFAPNERLGWLALHINNGRGTRRLLEQHFRERFSADFPDFTLTITPYVMESALRHAVENNLFSTVTLVRRDHPSDRAEAARNPWVESGRVGKVAMTIKTRRAGKTRHLVSGLHRQALDAEPGASDAIIEFRGETYEEVKVTVQLRGKSRTYYIEKPTSGHPVSIDMDLTHKPAAEDVYAGLRQALSTSRV